MLMVSDGSIYRPWVHGFWTHGREDATVEGGVEVNRKKRLRKV